MTAQRLTSVLTLALVFGATGVGCGDDPAPTPDAAVTAGRGGTGGSGGSAGRGGSGGRGGMGGSAGSTAGSGGATDAGGTAGTGGATTDGSSDTGAADGGSDSAVLVDAPADVAMTPDLPVDLPPDTMPTTMVTVTDCAQFNCPALTAVASACNGNDSACTYETTMTLPMKHTNYCHANGVKKLARTTYSGTGYTTNMAVKKSDGSACYDLRIVGSGSGTADVQNWTFRNPAGDQLATGVWRASDGRLTINCGGVSYLFDDIGCPGTDGQPDDGNDCTASTSCDD